MTTTRTNKTILDFGFWIFGWKTKNPKSKIQNPKSGEGGAALVSLLALMTVMAMLMLAAAPSILIDHQRGKEEEAVARGEEIAEAIRIYVGVKGRLPEKMEDLTEGVSIPGRTKKLMILRHSATIDPLVSDGEWKQIQSNETKVIKQFQSKLVTYTGSNVLSHPRFAGGQMAAQANQLFDNISGGIISAVIDTETDEETEPPGGEDSGQNVDGPFIAVVSRSQRKSVIAYYGIERHDRWLFTPLFRGSGNQGGGNFFPGPPPPTPPRIP